MISMDSALVFVVVIAAVIFIGSYAKILRGAPGTAPASCCWRRSSTGW